MTTINGKEVVFVEQPRSDRWWAVMPVLQKMQGVDGAAVLGELEWADVVTLVQAAVASWEFDGDPQDPEAIGALHPFKELIPLLSAFSQQVEGWTVTDPN